MKSKSHTSVVSENKSEVSSSKNSDEIGTPDNTFKIASPSPLALYSFSYCMLLNNFYAVGVSKDKTIGVFNSLIFGGIIQAMCGIINFFNGDFFSGTVFTAYGGYWTILYFIYDVKDKNSLILFNSIWAALTFVFVLNTINKNLVAIFTMILLTVSYALNAVSAAHENFKTTAGAFGIITGLFAFYFATAQFTNINYGKILLPLFEVNRAYRKKKKEISVGLD